MKKSLIHTGGVLVLISLLFSSCSKQDDFDYPNPPKEACSVTDFKVTPAQAVHRLQNFTGHTTTKTWNEMDSLPIEAITKDPCYTKSGSGKETIPDTLMYIINLPDNQGFALMSADKRTPPIFALVDKGSYTLREREKVSEKNADFGMFIDMTKDYVVYTITGNENNYGEGDGEWALDKYTLPKLNYYWDQEDPYNMYTPLKNNQHTYTGCVATALGMVTAHFNPTFSINGYTLTLSGPNIYTTIELIVHPDKANIVARLLREIGRNIGTTYGLNESTAPTANAEAYLKNQSNIKYITGFRTYQSDLAVNNLYTCLRSQKGLAVFYGAKEDNSSAHVWVVDGIKSYINLHNNTTLDLYHCNWGAGGDKDGYFLEAIYRFTASYQFISGEMRPNSPRKYPKYLKYCAVNNKRIE